MSLTVNTNIINDTDQYLLDAKNVKGTFVVVANTSERDALPSATTVEGSLCYCQSNSTFYQYNGSSWVEANLGGGGGGSSGSGSSMICVTNTRWRTETVTSSTPFTIPANSYIIAKGGDYFTFNYYDASSKTNKTISNKSLGLISTTGSLSGNYRCLFITQGSTGIDISSSNLLVGSLPTITVSSGTTWLYILDNEIQDIDVPSGSGGSSSSGVDLSNVKEFSIKGDDGNVKVFIDGTTESGGKTQGGNVKLYDNNKYPVIDMWAKNDSDGQARITVKNTTETVYSQMTPGNVRVRKSDNVIRDLDNILTWGYRVEVVSSLPSTPSDKVIYLVTGA